MIYQKLKVTLASPVTALAVLLVVDLAVAGCSTGRTGGSRLATPPDPPPVPRAKPVAPSFWSQSGTQSGGQSAGQSTVYTSYVAPAASVQSGGQRVHVITEGQSLYAVARLYGTTVGDLILTNQLAPPYKLTLGQRLVVPGAYGTAAATQPAAAAQTVAAQPAPIQAAHVVRSGDTVYSIARRYKVDMADLVRLNGIPASYQISPGQRLKLPGQAAAVAGLPAANGTKLSSAAAAPQPVAQATPAAWTQSSQASVVMMPPPEITGPIPEPPARAGSKFLWPVEGKLLKNYGPKQGGLHNDGINIAAARGSPVRAADNGVVAYVGNELRGFGNLLLIKHADGWMTAYAHNDAILVGRGAKVKRGQTVARVGDSGSVVTPQLHFEVRRGTRAVDPAKQLGPRQAAQNW
jgi:murein DD-endopeptidase MepM/ murein hydrolase activator NlpD